MLAVATSHTSASSTSIRAYYSANSYISELQSLYNQYILDETLKKLLKDKILRTNSLIDKFIADRENSYLLFCETDFEKAITNCSYLKKNTEFLLNAFSFIYHTTRDRNLKRLLFDSIEVLQRFIIKFSDFIDINNDLKNFSGNIDEDSIEYDNKFAEIIETISSKNNIKTGNSIRETLGL